MGCYRDSQGFNQQTMGILTVIYPPVFYQTVLHNVDLPSEANLHLWWISKPAYPLVMTNIAMGF